MSAVIPYLQVTLVYFALRLNALGSFSPSRNLWSKTAQIATIQRAAWFYLRDLVWPVHLTIFPDVTIVWRLYWRDFWLPGIALAAAWPHFRLC